LGADLSAPQLRDFVPTVAAVVTLLGASVAFVMALGAILIAAEVGNHGFAGFIYNFAESMSLGTFKPVGGLKEFGGGAAYIKDALFNWGFGALVWLGIGYGLGWAIRKYGPRLIEDMPSFPRM
jgi:hypothetical protein